VLTADNVALEAMPDHSEVLEGLPAEFHGVGVAVGALFGSGVFKEPMPALAFPGMPG
jgi:hypothetical protein